MYLYTPRGDELIKLQFRKLVIIFLKFAVNRGNTLTNTKSPLTTSTGQEQDESKSK